MKSFLNKPNKIILKKNTNTLNSKSFNKDDEKLCNCRPLEKCATDGKCLTKGVVYKAEVKSEDDNACQT